MEPGRHAIKYPFSWLVVSLAALQVILFSYMNFNYIDRHHPFLLFIGTIVVLILYGCLLSGSIYLGLQPSGELVFQDHSLIVNGVDLQAKEIAEIRIQGYFREEYGIRLHDKRIVPVKLCFRFVQPDDPAVQQLKQWGAVNQIPLVRKPFTRWI
ncbi:hypothetical protein [Paenibacillus gansuensis]|uniref:Uncharacterized protein n=1 Tax=Paenibacillus gansuensis TaxID=306542 RepID=A0ABW5P9A8_9BACL